MGGINPEPMCRNPRGYPRASGQLHDVSERNEAARREFDGCSADTLPPVVCSPGERPPAERSRPVGFAAGGLPLSGATGVSGVKDRARRGSAALNGVMHQREAGLRIAILGGKDHLPRFFVTGRLQE
jgi:hypothetical protein